MAVGATAAAAGYTIVVDVGHGTTDITAVDFAAGTIRVREGGRSSSGPGRFRLSFVRNAAPAGGRGTYFASFPSLWPILAVRRSAPLEENQGFAEWISM